MQISACIILSSTPDLLVSLDLRRAQENPGFQSCHGIPPEADAALHAALHMTCRSLCACADLSSAPDLLVLLDGRRPQRIQAFNLARASHVRQMQPYMRHCVCLADLCCCASVLSSAPDLLGLVDLRGAPENPGIQVCQGIPRETDVALSFCSLACGRSLCACVVTEQHT